MAHFKERVQKFLRAAEEGNIAVLASLLVQDDNDNEHEVNNGFKEEFHVDCCNSECLTALHFASVNNHENIVRFLITKGAHLEPRTKCGWTPLMFASHYGHLSIVNLLAQSKADVNIPNNMGATALICACRSGHSKVVRSLLDHGAELNYIDTGELHTAVTPLMAAAQHGHSPVVNLLIDHKVDVNYHHPLTGWTALQLASMNGHLNVVRLLVEAGAADTNAVNNNDQTACDVAALQARNDVEDYLAKKTTKKIQNKGNLPLCNTLVSTCLCIIKGQILPSNI